MGKGYKRKTRWRTLNIGAPPGEEDEEDGIRNSYAKAVENALSSRNGQAVHKSGRTDSAGSTTSDYASDYTSAASKSRRDDSGGSQPKIIFNENEYTRITTPRQDVLIKKGYLSSKKVWASTASTSATPSTTESQSASHSTADGSETTEDQQLEEYPGMGEPGAHVAYGTFYDHATGYYYEYPLMLVGPDGGIPGPAMHNVLTAVPCGPVPLRPIEWVNPAFVPKLGSQQYCVMDYQTAHLAQYPTLVDANGVPLPVPEESTNGSVEACHENGDETATGWPDVVDGAGNWTDVVDVEKPVEPTESSATTTTTVNDVTTTTTTTTTTETQNGTAEEPPEPAAEEETITETPVNPENYLEIALAQQLHVGVPPVPQPYMYPGHYMFGPSLFNVNGVTIQCTPMVQNTGVTGPPRNTGACAKRRKKKRFSKKKSRHPLGPGNAEGEEQEEEDYSSEAENVAGLSQIAGASEAGSAAGVVAGEAVGVVSVAGTSSHRPLNPDCQEFQPVQDSRVAARSAVEKSNEIASDPSKCDGLGAESSDSRQRDSPPELAEKPSLPVSRSNSIEVNNHQDATVSRIPEAAVVVSTNVETTEKLGSRSDEEVEAAPVEFAAEVFANVTNIAERALAPRGVVEGTPMETEIGLDVASVDFKEIAENLDARHPQPEEATTRNRRRNGSVEENNVPNGQATVDAEKSTTDGAAEVLPNAEEKVTSKRQRGSGVNDQRGSRSASPGIINRTTTPINAMTQRLPESYESLVTRGTNVAASSTSAPAPLPTTARNRKFSAKGPKFVREATPGPDLDAVQQQPQQQHQQHVELEDFARARSVKTEKGANSEPIVISSVESANRGSLDNEAIATGVEAIEAEVQRYSLSTSDSCCYTDSNGATKRPADASNDDSGIESQTRFSSDHPITDAVTEWLQRANSPELFVTSATSATLSESEPEDDELDDREPSKNLQGNPMPALSANSNVTDYVSSRLASCGEFAKVIDAPVSTRNERTSNDDNDNEGETERCVSPCHAPRILRSKKKRLGLATRRRSRKASTEKSLDLATGEQRTEAEIDAEAARRRVESLINARVVVKRGDVCEFTEKDSDAGVRVAKSSRRKKMTMTATAAAAAADSLESRVDKSRGSNARDNSTIIVLSSRATPVENVGVKVRRLTEDNDEGIVEDEEVSVRTYEKGEIVVSFEGKVLPVAAYEPVLLQHERNEDERTDKPPLFSKITCEKSRCDDETSTASDKSAAKRNSLGSIEEPDVLECWEVETVEPITTPKRQQRGTSQEGEAAEDDLAATAVDPAAVEIVRKYYRLEAMRDSGASVTSFEDEDEEDEDRVEKKNRSDEDARRRRDSLPNSPERMIESLCSEEIPVIGERMSKIVDRILNDSGIPVDEAVEVYESCYNGKPPNYLIGLDAKFRRNGTLFGRLSERDGAAVPCKAACCNIQ